MIKNNKAMELPINIVVSVIIGIVIFAVGLQLTTQIFSEGESIVSNENERVSQGIRDLQCQGDNSWICTPTLVMRNGERSTSTINIINLDLDSTRTFSVEFEGLEDNLLSSDCGSVAFSHYPNPFTVNPGEGLTITYTVVASRISEVPCSITTLARLKEDPNTIIDSTPVIIQVRN